LFATIEGKISKKPYPVLEHIFHCLADYTTKEVVVEIMKDIEEKVEAEEPRKGGGGGGVGVDKGANGEIVAASGEEPKDGERAGED
jgi:hypothetical protein